MEPSSQGVHVWGEERTREVTGPSGLCCLMTKEPELKGNSRNLGTLEATSRGRFCSGQTMWQQVEDAMRRLRFSQEWKSCKKKWEVIMTDFQKVYNYNRSLGGGIVSYYMLNEQERLTKRLPKPFPKERFDALVSLGTNNSGCRSYRHKRYGQRSSTS
jgi:hypothetical protein